jgi:hypothetical protein
LKRRLLGKELGHLLLKGYLNASIFMKEEYDATAPFIFVIEHPMFGHYFTPKEDVDACENCWDT